VNELIKIKEDVTKERDDLLAEISAMRDKLTSASAAQIKAENDREQAEAKIAEASCYQNTKP